MDIKDLKNRFKFHPATTDERIDNHENIRRMCLELAIKLDDMCPDGRELSLAVKNLEYVMFWANAAVARQPD
jgi:hypothetical protein